MKAKVTVESDSEYLRDVIIDELTFRFLEDGFTYRINEYGNIDIDFVTRPPKKKSQVIDIKIKNIND